ncbi:MAG: hypothetical protein ACRDJH_20140 [Thermomicrobiales bacterium]
METQQTTGPNPLCEVGRTHPRDRHRMRPVEGHPGVWTCSRHDLFATIVPKEQADEIERGDPFPMHDGGEGSASRTGDERHGGILLYYRSKNG